MEGAGWRVESTYGKSSYGGPSISSPGGWGEGEGSSSGNGEGEGEARARVRVRFGFGFGFVFGLSRALDALADSLSEPLSVVEHGCHREGAPHETWLRAGRRSG